MWGAFKRLVGLSPKKPLFQFKPDDQAEVWFCQADMSHHMRFFATGSFKDGRNTPTPVEVCESLLPLGLIEESYLDSFPPSSVWYDEIQAYKRQLNNPEGKRAHVEPYAVYSAEPEDLTAELEMAGR